MQYYTTNPTNDPAASRQLLELKTEKAVQSQLNGFLVGFTVLVFIIVGLGVLLTTSGLLKDKSCEIEGTCKNNKVHLMTYSQKLTAKINYNMAFLPISSIVLTILFFPLYTMYLLIRAAYWSQADQNYYEFHIALQAPVTSHL